MEALDHLENDNSAGEYYLGDVLPMLRDDGPAGRRPPGRRTRTSTWASTTAPTSRSSPPRRAGRSCTGTWSAGVTVIDPASTWIDADVEIGRRRHDRARHQPARRDSDRRRLHHRAAHDLDRHDGRRAGSRPALLPDRGARSATSPPSGPSPTCAPAPTLGAGRQGRHLRRDQELADRRGRQGPAPLLRRRRRRRRPAPTSARATITANYDGRHKHRDEDRGRCANRVNTSLVAPVTVGDGAYTGAGAVIREDVPDGALGVSTNEQRNIEGYAERKAERGRRGRGRGHRLMSTLEESPHADQLDRAGLHEAPDGLRRPRLDGARGADRRQARRRPRPGRPADLRRRRGLLPLPGVDPRRRHLPRPVHGRKRQPGHDPERRADGAAGDDRRRQGRVGAPDHRRHALVRLLAPGQEVGPPRADLRPRRRPMPRGRRRATAS